MFFFVFLSDLCGGATTNDYRLGSIDWPYTDVGTRRYGRCEYAYPWEYVYASNDCLVRGRNATPTWSPAPNMEDCPLPPFSRQLQNLCDNIVSLEISASLLNTKYHSVFIYLAYSFRNVKILKYFKNVIF